MSSKLKLKSTAGGSLSLIIDDALATDEEMNISDGGIVTVTNANGTAIKYPDGTMICHNKDLLPAEITTDTLYGSIYATAVGSNIKTFPVAFIDLPIVSCSPRLTSGRILGAVDFLTTTTSFDYMLSGSSSLGKAIPYYMAIGRWK